MIYNPPLSYRLPAPRYAIDQHDKNIDGGQHPLHFCRHSDTCRFIQFNAQTKPVLKEGLTCVGVHFPCEEVFQGMDRNCVPKVATLASEDKLR